MSTVAPARFARSHGAAAPGGSAAGAAGHFGRLFPPGQAAPLGEPVLITLATTMDEGLSGDDSAVDLAPPAGYTYLGQFIDHDMTLDRRLFGAPPTPGPVANFRSPALDLDLLYGDGPQTDAELYQTDGLRLRLAGHDLDRQPSGAARIKDARNDSNRIVSQLHWAFARFHNRVVDALGLSPGQPGHFERARQVVRRHYQWLVLHDFLPTLVGQATVDSLVGLPAGPGLGRLKLFAPGAGPGLPIEFSAAAFRFGHSMVRSAYQLNAHSGQILTFDRSRPLGQVADDLRGFRPLPAAQAITWDHFFALPGANPARLQRARPIDTLIARPLLALPVSVADSSTDPGRFLPFRNLHRGEINLGLPTGQEVAAEVRRRLGQGPADWPILGVDQPLRLRLGDTAGSPALPGGVPLDLPGLARLVNARAPLWYYLLAEAGQLQRGIRLGPVGGRIVAEVLVRVLRQDAGSILRGGAGWAPRRGEFGCPQDGRYGIADLLLHATGPG